MELDFSEQEQIRLSAEPQCLDQVSTLDGIGNAVEVVVNLTRSRSARENHRHVLSAIKLLLRFLFEFLLQGLLRFPFQNLSFVLVLPALFVV